ncbi:SapC family protein [Vreelandella venusta]|uniref:SapC family protein n=1 Tax=Vreelandella venusta TaxID=44935 RepID=UPI00384C46EC
MSQWTVISKSHHAQALYYPREGYHHAREQLVASVLLAELPKLVQHFTLGFMPKGERYVAVALLAVEQSQNLYVHPDGRWLGGYVPASLRGYPFSLLPDEHGQRVLCIDAEQLTDAADLGQPLFDEHGHPSTAVAKQLDFHKYCEANRQRTQQAVDALQQADVLHPWPLEVNQGEGETSRKIEGLYRIDEKALNTLEATTYATLQGAPMALAHAQLFSAHQLSQLTERARFHAQHASQEVPENLDSVLDGVNDDDLTFDFD